ncbi:MAG: DMT family transporter [Campylobacteraceae bacterium]
MKNNKDILSFMFLVLPPLFWAGNFVVGRAIRDEIPPLALSFGRWSIAFLVLLPFAIKYIKRDYKLYIKHKWLVLKMAIFGIAGFNTLVYLGLHSTTAINAILLNSFIPILIILFGALFFKQTTFKNQIIGMSLSFIGVFVIILHGNFANLLTLTFSKGDIIVFLAMVCWAFYTLWVRELPREINQIGLLETQITIALLFLLPFVIFEASLGFAPIWSRASVLSLLYVGIVPSVLAYIFYILAVVKFGSIRAGGFIHLMPVFGTILSIIFLGEKLYAFHIVGILIILIGLFISGKKKKA